MRFFSRPCFRPCLVLVLVALGVITASAAQPARPNFVVILCDDLGYADLGSYGHPVIQTPT